VSDSPRSSTLTVTDEGLRCDGLVIRSSGQDGAVPCVLIAPTVRGRTDFEEERARDLAGLGYTAVVMDLYGTGKRDEPRERQRERMQQLLGDRAALRRRLLAWVDAARSLPGVDGSRLAAIGYCFGGLCVLDIARSGCDLLGVVSFHAVLRPPPADAASSIRSRVLVLHGWDDPLAPPDAVMALTEELTAKGADWQIHAYGNTLHAFSNPAANDLAAGTVYNARANRRSVGAMTAFLAEIFGS
jgi:dienelactone hydrolase